MEYDRARREVIVNFAVYTLAHPCIEDSPPSRQGLLPEEIQRIVGNKTVPENSQQYYELILDPNFIKLSKNETDVATFNMKLISSAQIGKRLENYIHEKNKI